MGTLLLAVVILSAWSRGSGVFGVIMGALLGGAIAPQYHATVAQLVYPSAQILDPGAIEGFSMAYRILLFMFVVPAALVGWGMGVVVRGTIRDRRRPPPPQPPTRPSGWEWPAPL